MAMPEPPEKSVAWTVMPPGVNGTRIAASLLPGSIENPRDAALRNRWLGTVKGSVNIPVGDRERFGTSAPL